MSYVFNATKETQHVKALGNHFEIKPKQIKRFNDNIAQFLIEMRAENGLVGLSDSFDDPEYKTTPEGKAELRAAEDRGIKAYVDFHRSIIHNNQVSLRQNLEGKNLKIDPAALASTGELNSMKIVAAYQKAEEDQTQAKVDEVKELMKKVVKV